MPLTLVAGCGKGQPKIEACAPLEVSVSKVAAQDTSVSAAFDGQTESSRQVQIVARVDGFLERRRVYREGSLVKEGEVMCLQDQKPFKAALNAAKGALAAQQARLVTARQNLASVKPLVAQNALSQKDLGDATGQEQAATAAVETAHANFGLLACQQSTHAANEQLDG